jgi:hypothetical protein
VYAKFSAAEKAKHWQLRNPGKERGTGSTGGKKSGVSATNVSDFASAISSAVSAISALSDMTKRVNEEGTNDDPTDQSNRDNPALARQQTKKTMTWDPTTTHYSNQEAAMTGYSGNVVRCAAVGHVGMVAINLLSSLSSDLVDVTDDENFHQVLTL